MSANGAQRRRRGVLGRWGVALLAVTLTTAVLGLATGGTRPVYGDDGPPQMIDGVAVTAGGQPAAASTRTAGNRSSGTTRAASVPAPMANRITPLDVVMVLDTTYSMNGTPITNAKQAAHDLVNRLLPDPSGKVTMGVTAFRSGYAPECTTPAYWGYSNCVPATHNQALTSVPGAIDATVDLYTADGNTNICTGVERGWQILDGPGKQTDPATRRVMVLFTDGDNNPVGRSASAWSTNCDPGASHSSQGCATTPTSVELALDTKLYRYVQDLKSTQNVEFYVVAFGVCGVIPANNETTYCDPAKVGAAGLADSVHDRNLVKCIASSSPGTNDHYLEAASAVDLVPLFQMIGADVSKPSITNITPAKGNDAGGATIAISGAEFTPSSTVSIGGQPAAGVQYVHSGKLLATAPAGAPGVVPVSVDTPGQAAAVRTNGYTYELGAPTALTLTAATADSLSLSWQDQSLVETAMQVAYTKATPVDYQILNLTANATSTVISGLEPGMTYHSWVRACAANLCTAWTGVLTAVTPGALPPDRPTGHSLGAITNTSISMSWVDNATTEQSNVVAYTQEGTNNWQVISLPANTTTWTHTGLYGGPRWVYFVQACNGALCSQWSDGVVARAMQTPPDPIALTATPAAAAVSVSWQSPAGALATHFEVVWSPAAAPTYTFVSVSGSSSSWTHTGLTAGSDYFYWVRACADDRCSGFTGAVYGQAGAAPDSTITLVRGGPSARGGTPAQRGRAIPPPSPPSAAPSTVAPPRPTVRPPAVRNARPMVTVPTGASVPPPPK